MSINSADKKITMTFEHILCVYHLVYFKKDYIKIPPLLNLANEINIMTLIYVAILGFII